MFQGGKKHGTKKYNALEPQVSKWTYIIIGFVIVLIIGLLIGLQPSNQEKIKIFVNYDLVANDDFTEDHPFYEVSYRVHYLVRD